MNPDKATNSVLAICALHNFWRKRWGSNITSTNFDRQDGINILENGDWRQNGNELPGLQHIRAKNVSDCAKINRDKYMHFFNNKGSTPFQDDLIKAGRA